MKRIIWGLAAIAVIALFFAACGTSPTAGEAPATETVQGIETPEITETPEPAGIAYLPYPAAENGYAGLDAWHCHQMNVLWAEAELIVAGKYLDMAPELLSARAPDSPGGVQFSKETLLYRFRAEAVLKGELSNEEITVAHHYGIRTKENGQTAISVFESFAQPDAEGWKILFLHYSESADAWYITGVDLFLTAVDSGAADWEDCAYRLGSPVAGVVETFELLPGDAGVK